MTSRSLTSPQSRSAAMQREDGVAAPGLVTQTTIPTIADASSPRKTQILLVQDQPMLREHLAQHIHKNADWEICGEADDQAGAKKLILERQPELAIVDLTLRHSSGMDLLKEIKLRGLKVRVLVLSSEDEALYAERALRAGARGYVSKSETSSEVMRAMRKVLNGEVYLSERMTSELLLRMAAQSGESRAASIAALSDRELQVFQLIGRGKNTHEIARELGISQSTVATFRVRIKHKIGTKDAAELCRRATDWMKEQERASGVH
jgi:DNA-binding NarL/FixJ family response regulator